MWLRPLQGASNHGIYALCKVLDVTVVQSSHGDPSIRRHVDMRLVSKHLRLWPSQPSETVP